MDKTMTVQDLRKSDVMAHLLDALEAGQDIGHYGRLVFVIVARHFLSEAELIEQLQKDIHFSEREAKTLYQQVQDKDYNPPKRDRILEWQTQQAFSICPHPEDPDACNLYGDLDFPAHIYEQIDEYHAEQQV